MKPSSSILALTLALAAAPAAAQQQSQQPPQQPLQQSQPSPADAGAHGGLGVTTQLGEQDRDFAEQAAAGGMMEVRLGEMAGERAQRPEVKRFGQRMVEDHGQANRRLDELARKAGISLPQTPPGEKKEKVERLSGLQGEAFDEAYMKLMVEDHKEDIELFQKQAREGRSADLKTFAERTLPTLEEHLRMAEEIAAPGMAERPDAPRDSGSTPRQ